MVCDHDLLSVHNFRWTPNFRPWNVLDANFMPVASVSGALARGVHMMTPFPLSTCRRPARRTTPVAVLTARTSKVTVS